MQETYNFFGKEEMDMSEFYTTDCKIIDDNELILFVDGPVEYKDEIQNIVFEKNHNVYKNRVINSYWENDLGQLVMTININDFLNSCDHGSWEMKIETKNKKVYSLLSKKTDFVRKSDRFLFKKVKNDTHVISLYLIGLKLYLGVFNKLKFSEIQLDTEVSYHAIKRKKDKIIGKIKINLEEYKEDDWQIEKCLLIRRDKQFSESAIVHFDKKMKKTKGKELHFIIDKDSLDLKYHYWDFYIVLAINEKRHYIRLKNPSKLTRFKLDFLYKRQIISFPGKKITYPYTTDIGTYAMVSRDRTVFDRRSYTLKVIIALIIALFMKLVNRKRIWLFFEKFSERAQDNSITLFNYLDEKRNYKYYYIIKEGSKDIKNILDRKKIIYYSSLKYLILLILSDLLISSESRSHIYDVRIHNGLLFHVINLKKHIFLQHGVIGLKKIDNVYKKSKQNSPDFFVVSTKVEKNIVRDSFGYTNAEIFETGLCRWDETFKKENEITDKDILFMPTWRTWLENSTENEFIKSRYYNVFLELLKNERLEKTLLENNRNMYFFIHPKFEKYMELLIGHLDVSKNIIINPHNLYLKEILNYVGTIITDYSSIAWDGLYKDKNVILFQFDKKKYELLQGSYIKDDIFTNNTTQDITGLLSLLNREFNRINIKKDEIFFYQDKHNCQRVLDCIELKGNEIYKKNYSKNVYFKYFKKHSKLSEGVKV